ncbi:hypothetical protein FGIG_11487 [Fasciola gigantica]|uniref:Uncharacterized protein n=1 Tax=Fasciola gigantica TaxID=46835 RepID=A0A504YDV9_FASGI|nr:hypothetical protein FGIG_11487 [Fasciola gigantica]
MLDADDSVAIVHSNWLTDGNREPWPKSSTFQAYQGMLLDGGCLPERVPAYEFHEISHPASTDDTLPVTPFSERYTVRRRIPVPLSSDDSTIEIPLPRRIRRESPIQSPDSPGDVMALGHSSPR